MKVKRDKRWHRALAHIRHLRGETDGRGQEYVPEAEVVPGKKWWEFWKR